MMVSRRPTQEEHIPSEILWGSANNSSSNFYASSAQSCVSSVTRELPDIDAPQLYPSIESVIAEIPDLQVSSDLNNDNNDNAGGARLEVSSSAGGIQFSYQKQKLETTRSANSAQALLLSANIHSNLKRTRSNDPPPPPSYQGNDSLRSSSFHSLRGDPEGQQLPLCGRGRPGSSELDTQSHGSRSRNSLHSLTRHLTEETGTGQSIHEQRLKSSRLLSPAQSGHQKDQQSQFQQEQQQQVQEMSPLARTSSPSSALPPTPDELGYNNHETSPGASPRRNARHTQSCDNVPVPARRMSYNSAALCGESSISGTEAGEDEIQQPTAEEVQPDLRGLVAPALTRSSSDAAPQRPQRRGSTASLAHYQRPPATSNRSRQRHPVNSTSYSKNELDYNNRTPSSNLPRRSNHSNAGLSRASEHSFCQDSVASNITDPTFGYESYQPSRLSHDSYDYHRDRADRIPEESPYHDNGYSSRGGYRPWDEEPYLRSSHNHRDPSDFHREPPSYQQALPPHGDVRATLAVGEDPYRHERRASSNSYGNTTYHNRSSHGQAPPVFELEIQPGHFVPLRGSEETLDAMNNDFILNISCFACTTKVQCIADSEYVLCPICKVVSPIDHNLGSGTGVGLGFEQK